MLLQIRNFYYDEFIQGCSISYGHAWDLCFTETKHSALSVHRTPDCVMYGTMQGSYLRHGGFPPKTSSQTAHHARFLEGQPREWNQYKKIMPL